ncbi:MAG: hypothetical protein K2M53_01300 [Muribaculaceae bacterium]|nr:hypothetical protein [Muribaculaceae bacterium]
MEEVLRYILIAVIIYVIGMEIYKAVRTRSIDYTHWAIIGLFGIAIWLSRGFLITCQISDWAIWIVCLLTIGSFIVPKQLKAGRWVKGGALSSLSLAVIGFVTLNIIAKQKDSVAIETPLNGYSISRIGDIYFRYNGKSFGRTFNLREYSGAKDLRNDYNVELTVIPIAADIAKIESIDLVPKQKMIDQKGGKR